MAALDESTQSTSRLIEPEAYIAEIERLSDVEWRNVLKTVLPPPIPEELAQYPLSQNTRVVVTVDGKQLPEPGVVKYIGNCFVVAA
mgnify:CR=1 FL=1